MFEQDLRDKGETEENIKSIMAQKEEEEKQKDREAAKKRMKDLERSLMSEAA